MSRKHSVQGGVSLSSETEGWVRLAVTGQAPCSIPAAVAVILADTIERLDGFVSDAQREARINGDGTDRFRATDAFEVFDARYQVGVYGDRVGSITAKDGAELGVVDAVEDRWLIYASVPRAGMPSLVAGLRAAALDAAPEYQVSNARAMA
jgi:hypothetical protein